MRPIPLALSLSEGWSDGHQGFDKLSPNGYRGHRRIPPLALSLSKGWSDGHQGFDKLSPNGCRTPPFALSLSKGCSMTTERFMYIA